MSSLTLEDLRARIDEIDAQLLALLNRRASVSLEVAELKRSQSADPVYHRPEREVALLDALQAANEGPLPAQDLEDIYRVILASSRGLQSSDAAGAQTPDLLTAHGKVSDVGESAAQRLGRLAFPGVRSLKPYEPGKPEEELRRELGLNRIVKLASNENPLGPGALAIAAVHESAEASHRYPDGNGFALKERLASRLDVDPAQITLGNGSDNLFELLARTFLTPEREAVFSQHGFAMYPIVTQTAGARPVEVPARDWGHDLDAMLGAVTARTAIVFIANPNNPTGTWTRADEVEQFLAAVPPTVIVVLDEAYREYVTEPEYPDGIALCAKYPNVVVTRTFSKIHGLGGLRVGYGVSHPALADLLNRARSPFNVSRPAQAGALAALDDEAHITRSREMNETGMVQLVAGFRSAGTRAHPVARQLRFGEGARGRRRNFRGAAAPRRDRARADGLWHARSPASDGRHTRGERGVPRGAGSGT